MDYQNIFVLSAFLGVLSNFPFVTSQDQTLTIQLNGTLTPYNSELYGDFHTINISTILTVTLTDIQKEVSFIIFQVHTYVYNVTLYKDVMQRKSTINGTNVGLYTNVISNGLKPTFSIANFNNDSINTYISIHGYNSTAPIPGGCNMEFNVPIAPFLEISYNKDLITVGAASAKDPKDLTESCSNISLVNLSYDFYRIYLNEKDFSQQEYFDGIKKMLTLKSISEHGELIPRSISGYMIMKRLFSLYYGTGSVYVVVVKSPTGSAVYVPTHTYGCTIDDGDCIINDDILSEVLCAFMIFLGIFTCYFGHRFFKTEMFLVGLLAGAIVTYIFFAKLANLDQQDLVGASLISGLCAGAIWYIFWWFYGIPVLAVLLPTLVLGFLTSSVIFYGLPDGIQVLEDDINFWFLFIAGVILIPIAIISATLHANILFCSVVGSYAVLYPLDLYIGSNLKYIVINTVRRAVVSSFNKASTAPPFQWKDAVLVLLWVMLSITGFLYQHYITRGKPPFPPPPRSTIPTIPTPRPRLYTYESVSTEPALSRNGRTSNRNFRTSTRSGRTSPGNGRNTSENVEAANVTERTRLLA